jgi:hypothetical protein
MNMITSTHSTGCPDGGKSRVQRRCCRHRKPFRPPDMAQTQQWRLDPRSASGAIRCGFSITVDAEQRTRRTIWPMATRSISRPVSCAIPAKSSYGPTEWDKPCTKASKPITFQVTAWLACAGTSVR